jgi:two-component system, cell cycle response regulator DivK
MNDIANWNVLIVDDEPDNVGVIELVLSFHNAQVRTAESGLKCIQMMEEDPPTLLLVDIQMPGMSGMELMEKVREREAWRNIPVVVVTAHAMRGDNERFLAAGFDGYIPKPINAMTFADELRLILTAKVQV